MDQISLNYSKIEIDYLAQDEKGITQVGRQEALGYENQHRG